MIIPKQLIAVLKESKIAEFVDLSFLNNFSEDTEFQLILDAAKNLDSGENNTHRIAVIESIPINARLWLQIEGTKMKEVYHVFNPMTGQHTTCNSLEEAIETRQQIMRDYLETHKHIFSVAQEIETFEGNTLWNPIDIDKIAGNN